MVVRGTGNQNPWFAVQCPRCNFEMLYQPKKQAKRPRKRCVNCMIKFDIKPENTLARFAPGDRDAIQNWLKRTRYHKDHGHLGYHQEMHGRVIDSFEKILENALFTGNRSGNRSGNHGHGHTRPPNDQMTNLADWGLSAEVDWVGFKAVLGISAWEALRKKQGGGDLEVIRMTKDWGTLEMYPSGVAVFRVDVSSWENLAAAEGVFQVILSMSGLDRADVRVFGKEFTVRAAHGEALAKALHDVLGSDYKLTYLESAQKVKIYCNGKAAHDRIESDSIQQIIRTIQYAMEEKLPTPHLESPGAVIYVESKNQGEQQLQQLSQLRGDMQQLIDLIQIEKEEQTDWRMQVGEALNRLARFADFTEEGLDMIEQRISRVDMEMKKAMDYVSLSTEAKIAWIKEERSKGRSWRDLAAEAGVSHAALIKLWKTHKGAAQSSRGYHPPMTMNRIYHEITEIENSGNPRTIGSNSPMTMDRILESLGPARLAKAEALLAFLKQCPNGATKKEIQIALGLLSRSDAFNVLASVRPLIREEIFDQKSGEKRYFLR